MAAIRGALNITYGVVAEESFVWDLARCHTVRSAIQVVGQKLALHSELPVAARKRLAVAEAAVDDGTLELTPERREAIIAVRRKTLAALHDEMTADAATVQSLLLLEDDITAWSAELRRYLREYARLYENRVRELRRQVPSSALPEALLELSQPFVTALTEFCRVQNKGEL